MATQVPRRERLDSLRPLPDHAELLYVSNVHGQMGRLGVIAGELYAMDSEGRAPVRVTHDGWTHNHLSVSPDRRYIVTNRHTEDWNRDGKLDFRDRKTLWVLDLEKGEQWPLVLERDAGWGGVDWSPDGEWVYAAMTDEPVDRKDFYRNRIDIFRVRPDGTGLERLTDGMERQLWDGADGKFVADVGIAPDGERMAFTIKPIFAGTPWLKSRICVARVDGSAARLVTDGGPLDPVTRGPWSIGDFDPEFSPDGRAIVFGRATDAGFNDVDPKIPGTPSGKLSSYDIVRANVDGSDVRRLTPEGDPALKGIPDWSRDDRIVFRELDARDGFMGPVVMNDDGSGRRRIAGILGRHFRWIPPL